jgi:hypothetical protein
MTIRTFTAGDDVAQVSIYNEAAADLPKFKPVTLDELRRRLRGPDFDPTTRYFAEESGRPVGYASFHANGRVSFPWCRKGREQWAEPLLEAVLQAMRSRSLSTAFAAYRADWPVQCAFFRGHGFTHAREMVNFVMALTDMPTPSARPATTADPLQPSDVPAVLALAPTVFRVPDAAQLEAHWLHNTYFPPSAVWVLRSRADAWPVGLGVLVANAAYADPREIDAAMPCFRLGAVGTEDMQTKRVNGLFSFAAADGRDFSAISLDLLSCAVLRLQETEASALAAQVPSDAPHLLRFYKQFFRRQGSFPVFERSLA